MPDRELPDHLKAQLDRELTGGAPLMSPQPAQARYSQLPTPVVSGFARWRLLSALGAAAALVAVTALAGPPQARDWIGQSVVTLAHDVQRSTGGGSPSPSPKTSPAQQPSVVPPTPHDSPEPAESPEPSESPDDRESPQPSQSPDDHHGEPSPSPEPSGGGTDGGTDGGGDTGSGGGSDGGTDGGGA